MTGVIAAGNLKNMTQGLPEAQRGQFPGTQAPRPLSGHPTLVHVIGSNILRGYAQGESQTRQSNVEKGWGSLGILR